MKVIPKAGIDDAIPPLNMTLLLHLPLRSLSIVSRMKSGLSWGGAIFMLLENDGFRQWLGWV